MNTHKGILLAVFGSGNPQGELALQRFAENVRHRFPGIPVRWAFTSSLLRERLAKAKKKSDSVCKALQRMAFEGITRIALQPLHVVPGLEYTDIIEECNQFTEKSALWKDQESQLILGEPLLSDHPDACDLATYALLQSCPESRQSAEVVLWMGHGSQLSDKYYLHLAQNVAMFDPLIFIATLNGITKLEDVLPHLHSGQRVWLLPLLANIGRHTLEDMSGPAPESWQSRLSAAKIESIPILRGMLESPSFTALWLDHLQNAVERLH